MLDPESGLYYYGGRYYDPELGRWISADPTIPYAADPQSHNRYSYVVNNPVNGIDPDGYHHIVKKKKAPLWRTIVGFIAGAVVGWVTGGYGVYGAYIAAGATKAVATAAATSIGALVGGTVSAGIAGGNPVLGGLTAFVTAGGLGGGVFGGFGFESLFGASASAPLSNGAAIFAAEAANVFTRGFIVGALGSLASGEKPSNALKHGLLSAAIHLGGVEVNNLIGHTAGLIASGGQAPRVEQGVFVYEANVRPFAFGNAVTGPDWWLESKASLGGIAAPHTVLKHEVFHVPQSGVFGAAYGLLHLLSQGASYLACGSTHRCNPLERGVHPYPDYN